jgi:predicted AlkP superfamily pyrophosphatase or phosphodiesterase
MRPAELTRRLFLTVALLALACLTGFSQTASRVVEVPNPPNSAAQQQKPYVVLVSLDGFRYDYLRKYAAPHLAELAARGASVPDGMLPSYPSTTFPNHLSIITGLYPEHHGIVANVFYDPARGETYSYGDHKTSWDGSWYSGVPLWSLAENSQMRAACFFWPASEAHTDDNHWNAGDKRPSYFVPFDPNVPYDERVQQVLAWLQLPPAQRPHFITLYMEAVDAAGHQFGPDAPQTADAVKLVDTEIGKLEAGLEPLHLRVDLFVVADHGMQTTDPNWVNLDEYADLSNFKTAGPLLYAATDADAQRAYEELKDESRGGKSLRLKNKKFRVYRRADVPAYLHYNESPRTGDPVVVATGPYYIRAKRPNKGEPDNPPSVGTHGYDPYMMATMKALFVAAGPDIRAGATVPPFENVNVYPAIAAVLGLPVGKIDGDPKVLERILKK